MAVSPRGVRVINRAELLNYIVTHGSITRVQLSELTGLNQSTVSKIVSSLIREGIVYEASRGESTLGRKPVQLKLNAKFRIYGIVDMALWVTVLAVCDLSGQVLARREVDTRAAYRAGDDFLEDCAGQLEEMLEEFEEPLAGVVTIVPCVIDSHRGFIYFNTPLEWKDVDAAEIFGRHFDCRVIVENDARAAAMAELSFGQQARNLTNFVYILVCDGIGTGIVIGRQIYYGAHSINGQFGAGLIKINDRWEDFSDGDTWEDKASDVGVVERYCELSGRDRQYDTEKMMQRIIDLAESGDYQATRALTETARCLGVGIANINNGLDPEKIILGGKITRVWDLVFPEMLDQVKAQTNYQVVPLSEQIVPGSVPNPTFEGGRALILQELFGGEENDRSGTDKQEGRRRRSRRMARSI